VTNTGISQFCNGIISLSNTDTIQS